MTCPLYQKRRRKQLAIGGKPTRHRRRIAFVQRNHKAIYHAMSHWNDQFKWNAPIYVCQHDLVEKFRKEIPYGKDTSFRDVFWALWRTVQRYEATPDHDELTDKALQKRVATARADYQEHGGVPFK